MWAEIVKRTRPPAPHQCAPRRLAARFAGVFGLAVHELPFPVSPFHIDLIRARCSLGDRALDWLTEEIQIALADKRGREATSTELPTPTQIDSVRSALLEHALQSGFLQRDAYYDARLPRR